MFRWMYRNIPESTQDSECQYVHIGWMRIYFHSVYWREVCDEVQCSIGKEGGGGFEGTSAPQRIDDIAVKIFASGLSTTSMMYTYTYVCACIALVSHFVAVANYM